MSRDASGSGGDQQGAREQRRQDARLFDDVLLHVCDGRGRRGRHPTPFPGCSARTPRGWRERPGARPRRADRPPSHRGSPPDAGAPSGRRSRASSVREPEHTPGHLRNLRFGPTNFALDRCRARSRRAAIPSLLSLSAVDPEGKGATRWPRNFRITYATLSADNEDLQRNYDEAVERARAELGKEWPVRRERRGALDRREVRGALADRLRHHHRPVLPGHPRGRGRCRRRRQGLLPRMGADGLEGAGPDPPQRRRRDGGPRCSTSPP